VVSVVSTLFRWENERVTPWTASVSTARRAPPGPNCQDYRSGPTARFKEGKHASRLCWPEAPGLRLHASGIQAHGRLLA